MRPFEHFLISKKPFRILASLYIDKYITYLLHQKLSTKVAYGLELLLLLLLKGTIGQKFMQIQQNYRPFKYFNNSLLPSMLFVGICRYFHTKFPLLDNVLWLLYVQESSPIMAIEHIAGDYTILQDSKVAELLGYLSTIFNLTQQLSDFKQVKRINHVISIPYNGMTVLKCHKCNSEFENECFVTKDGEVHCEQCSTSTDRKVYIK